jgi:hypothetical protein
MAETGGGINKVIKRRPLTSRERDNNVNDLDRAIHEVGHFLFNPNHPGEKHKEIGSLKTVPVGTESITAEEDNLIKLTPTDIEQYSTKIDAIQISIKPKK